MTQLAAHAVPDTTAAEPETRTPREGPSWVRIFVGGLVLWSAAVLVTFATRNSNLVPTIILLGSFLVPVAFVTYAFGRADEVVTAQRIFTAFVYGGVLGVPGACPATACGTGSCWAPRSGSASPRSRAPGTPSTRCSPPAGRRC